MSVSMINKKSACVGSTNAFGLRNNFGKRILSPQYIRLWAKSQQSNAEKFWSEKGPPFYFGEDHPKQYQLNIEGRDYEQKTDEKRHNL